ncbi:hypothetical protein [Paenibacillus kandeliae]|uniref:hypothetical protein n=1 Tax=Paenibacillus kandeliae TaxID=3231269 RepID=UPI0034583DEE
MITMIRDKNRFTFPITPTEFKYTIANEVDTFTVMSGDERSGATIKKLKQVTFSAIFPRGWQDIWETGKETVKYKSPEQAIKLLEQWIKKPVYVNFDSLWSKTLKLLTMDVTYKDGQNNAYIDFTLVEYFPVKVVSYSNTKQLLKPGVVITKSAKSRPNASGKSSKKNNKKSSSKKKKSKTKAKSDKKKDSKSKNDNAKGSFDYIAQKNKVSSTISSKK